MEIESKVELQVEFRVYYISSKFLNKQLFSDFFHGWHSYITVPLSKPYFKGWHFTKLMTE